MELGFLFQDTLLVRFGVVGGKFDEGRVRLFTQFVGVYDELRPTHGRLTSFLDVGQLRGGCVGVVEVAVVVGDVSREARAHELFGGRGGTLARQHRFAAGVEEFAAAAGAGLSANGSIESGGRSGHEAVLLGGRVAKRG